MPLNTLQNALKLQNKRSPSPTLHHFHRGRMGRRTVKAYVQRHRHRKLQVSIARLKPSDQYTVGLPANRQDFLLNSSFLNLLVRPEAEKIAVTRQKASDCFFWTAERLMEA